MREVKEVEYSGERREEERTLKNFYRVIKRKSDSDLSWGTTLDIKPDPDLLHLAITHSGDEQIKIVINFNLVFLTSVNWTYRGWGELCRLIWPRAINTIHHAIGSAIDIKLSDWCVSIKNHLNCVITFFITYFYILIQKVRWAFFPCSLPKTQLCNVLCTFCFCRGGMGVWVWAVSVLV